jgi:hypothetical protein
VQGFAHSDGGLARRAGMPVAVPDAMTSINRFAFIGSLLFCATVATTMGAGCATATPVVRLQPGDVEDVTWVSGRAVASQEEDDVHVAAAFETQNGKILAVRVEIVNDSNDKLDIDPSDMAYRTCRVGLSQGCGKYVQVINPERMLAQLDARRARAEADDSNEQAFLTPLLFVSAMGDVASVATRRATSTTGLQTHAIASQMDASEARRDRIGSGASADKHEWANVALRRTTLRPGGAVAGHLYFPLKKNARFVWLEVRVGDRVFPFCFRQSVSPVS